MVAMPTNTETWDNEDIASNCAAEVCRIVCEMKGVDPRAFEPGLQQLSHDVYFHVMQAMTGRDRMMQSDHTRN